MYGVDLVVDAVIGCVEGREFYFGEGVVVVRDGVGLGDGIVKTRYQDHHEEYGEV